MLGEAPLAAVFQTREIWNTVSNNRCGGKAFG